MRRCPQCRANVVDGRVVCERCGADVAEARDGSPYLRGAGSLLRTRVALRFITMVVFVGITLVAMSFGVDRKLIIGGALALVVGAAVFAVVSMFRLRP